MIAYVFAATLCGVSFSLPKGWRAEVDEPGGNVRCEIVLTPPRWDDVNDASAWGSHDSPATIFLFKSPYVEDAMDDTGFEKDEEGHWTFPSRGRNAPADAFRIGKWSGVRSEGWYRAYATDRRKVAPEESSVYAVATFGVVLKKGRRVAGMMCDSGTPSYQVDCDALISRIFKSLR